MGNYKKEDRWDTLAATLGNQVLMQCPRWLVFVEGVGHCMSKQNSGPCSAPSASGQNIMVPTWWGENLQAYTRHPIELHKRRKLVLSPHVYGPSVHFQPYFSEPNFP